MSGLGTQVNLQILVDCFEHPCFVLDATRRILLINRSFAEEFRIDHDFAVGRPIASLVKSGVALKSTNGRAEREPPFAGLVDVSEGERVTQLYQDRHGEQRKLHINTYPLRAAAEEIYIGDLAVTDAAAVRLDPSHRRTPTTYEMVGECAAFRLICEQLIGTANTDAPVLLQGETGTGKELAAEFIHAHSARRAAAFVTVDCTTLCGELFESELFGHERGAFTGSLGRKRGLFELADGGTLFLDEIGEMPSALQAKLLRALESGEYRSVGSTKTSRVDTRIICATNRDLVTDSTFRRDLYYRIACLKVQLPSLAERKEDIPVLARSLLFRISKELGRELSIDRAATELLKGYHYAGNIRELRNVLWACTTHARHDAITERTITQVLSPQGCQHADASGAASRIDEIPQLGVDCKLSCNGNSLAELEFEHLARLIAKHDGNRTQIARDLGVSVRTVYRKLKRHRLN